MTLPDLHDRILSEIDARTGTLRSGALASAPDSGARSQGEVQADLVELDSDRELLLNHWRTRPGLVAASEPTRASACGQPQPCPHVLGLAEKYGVL